MATDVDGLHVQYKSKIHLVHITMTSFRRQETDLYTQWGKERQEGTKEVTV